ncbi:MAG: VWA domain-containing protein [Pseudomonadota bacterium]|nr:VWA domain-containing protein [Pseudomonadota bacterium]
MPEAGFHFEQSVWFWALLALLPVAVWLWRSAAKAARGPIHRYADPHLLPHLTGTRELKGRERWGRFLRWSLLWALLITAMAGPRWDYEDVRLFHPGNNMLILIDISRSMQVDDVAPSRLGRARQEIQDLILQNRQVRLGLIAFASVPHVLSPITEDTYTILNALPALSTDLARLQGSRLNQALDRAETLLGSLPEDSARSVLLISDGDFDEPDLVPRIEKLAGQGIKFHVLSVGTEEGARVPAQKGGWIMDRYGQPIRSVLNETLLEELARAGQGTYQRADYRDDDTEEILETAAVTRLPPEAGDERTRIWNERFYLPLLVIAALLVPQFRGRAVRRRKQ